MNYSKVQISDNELWESSEKAVRGYINKVFPTFFRQEDVEDMVVEAAARAWKKVGSYDPARGPWFNLAWTIAKNVVLTQAVRLKRERDRFTSLDRMRSADPDAFDTLHGSEPPADTRLLVEELQETFLGRLAGERDRLIFSWILDGLDDGQIADRLEISKPAAYTAVSRVRSRLRCAA